MSSGFEEYGLKEIRDIFVQCGNCDHKFFIRPEEIESEIDYENASMGTRINYKFYSTCYCPNCEQEIIFEQGASEYPEGSIEDIWEPRCFGADILTEPEIDMPYYDEDIYFSDDSIYTNRLEAEPEILNLRDKLYVDIVDGDAHIGNQLYIPNKRTTLWKSSSGKLLPILLEETGSIRFEDNRFVFAEVLQSNPKIGAMRLLGKVAEAVIVRNCNDDELLNRRWLSKARKIRTMQKVADSFRAIGTGLNSTKERFPQKYSPSDPQRDIIWINDVGEYALIPGRQSAAGVTAGLQVKVSGNGLSYLKKSLVNRRYEVPLVYFPINDDFNLILDKVNARGNIVLPGVDFIDVRELDEDAFFEIEDYYPLLLALFAGQLSADKFIREATGIMPLRNGIIAAVMSAPQSDIRIIH